jgi:hypothetical protein
MRVENERDHDRVLLGVLQLVDALREDLPELTRALRRDPNGYLRAAELPLWAELRPACVDLVEDRLVDVARRAGRRE